MTTTAAALDINKYDKNGETALYRAAERGDTTEVERLLAAGADPNVSDFSQLTALHVAKTFEVVRLLVDHGADIDALTKNRYGLFFRWFVLITCLFLVDLLCRVIVLSGARRALNSFVSRAPTSIIGINGGVIIVRWNL
jgi:hypothetical protein